MRGLIAIVLVAACEGGSTAPDAGISSHQTLGGCDSTSWGGQADECSRACFYNPTTSAMYGRCDALVVAPDGTLRPYTCRATFMFEDVRGCCEELNTGTISFAQCAE